LVKLFKKQTLPFCESKNLNKRLTNLSSKRWLL
jgi:hypothetical protein